MQIAIGKLNPELEAEGWVWYDPADLHPVEIRENIIGLCRWEEDELDAGGDELRLVTTNRTVIDMAVPDTAKHSLFILHDDVFVIGRTGILIPLLDMHDSIWLAHARLGDYYDRAAIDVPKCLDTLVVALAGFSPLTQDRT